MGERIFPNMAEEPQGLGSSNTPTPRQIVRLFQCLICRRVITEPLILPCGYYCCQKCQPPGRCPSCNNVHDSQHGRIDQTLEMVAACFEIELERLRVASLDMDMCAEVGVLDFSRPKSKSRIIHKFYPHSKLLAIWDLVQDGILGWQNDISYFELWPSPEK